MAATATTAPYDEAAKAALLPGATRLGPAHLTVRDAGRSVAFYRDALGLQVLRDEGDRVALGAGAEPAVVLHEDRSAPLPGRRAGLYHHALLHPSREELARTALRLAETRTPISGASDHGSHEAIYLDDPDGIGVELAADRARSDWPSYEVEFATGPRPLDFEALLAVLDERRATPQAAPGVQVGHLHLHTNDLERAVAFHRDVTGLAVLATLRGAAFLGAGGYHHHVAVNTWRGEGIPAADPTAVGLREGTLVLPTAQDVAALAARAGDAATPDGDALVLTDPAGIRLRVEADASPLGAAYAAAADVVTDRPGPYLQQVAKHFRHKLPVRWDEGSGLIPLAGGRAQLVAADGVLHLKAVADDAAALDRITDVLGSHLERFGRKDGLEVTWQSPGA